MKQDKPIIKEITSIYENRFLNIYDLNHIDEFHYYLASRKDKKNIVCNKTDKERQKLIPDAVTCIVTIQEEDEKRMLVFYEYRYPIGDYVLSVPSGLYETGDNSLFTSVKREIHEETGILLSDSDSIKMVCPLLFSTPGFTDESTAFVYIELKNQRPFCTNKENVGAEKVKDYTFITKKEARELLNTGKDRRGCYYSIATWVALSYFVNEIE